MIAVTLLWVMGQLVAATRQRIPAYEPQDTPREASQDVTADGKSAAHPGGER